MSLPTCRPGPFCTTQGYWAGPGVPLWERTPTTAAVRAESLPIGLTLPQVASSSCGRGIDGPMRLHLPVMLLGMQVAIGGVTLEVRRRPNCPDLATKRVDVSPDVSESKMGTCAKYGVSRVHIVPPDTTADVSADSEGKPMDEPVRWVTKAEAAQELEIPLSTLDRKIRKGEVEVVR